MLFETVKRLLDPLGFSVYDTDATGAKVASYFIVLGATPTLAGELDVCGHDMGANLIIRAVGVTPEQTRGMLTRSRKILRFRQESSADGAEIYAFAYDGMPRGMLTDRIQPDTGLNTNVYFADDEYTINISYKNPMLNK